MSSKYVVETGEGYVGIFRARRWTIRVNVSPIDPAPDSSVYAIAAGDRQVHITTDSDAGAVLDERTATDTGFVEFGLPVADHLEVDDGDDVRLYEDGTGLLAVPASDDPRLQTDQPGGTSP